MRMTLKARHAAKGDVVLKVSNLVPITEFKAMYIKALKKEKNEDISSTDNVRMFAMGKELKDDLFLYSYDLLNESTVQVMIKK